MVIVLTYAHDVVTVDPPERLHTANTLFHITAKLQLVIYLLYHCNKAKRVVFQVLLFCYL